MLKLKTLKYKNIGRFVEQQEINFTKLGYLVQVDAINNNTEGGSSGSGKSTVFNALDWLLGLSDLSTTVLQSRLTEKHISVEGQFDWDGKEVLIQRAKKLLISVDGVETTGSSKLSEEKLDEILGMPRHLFHPLLHKKQGDQGFFLQMTPSKMNEFLADCLGLSAISSKIDLIDLKLKDLVQSKTQSQSDLQALQAALQATQDALVSLGSEPTTNVTEAIIEGYKTQYETGKLKLSTTEENHKQIRAVLEGGRPYITVVPYDKAKLDALEAEAKTIESQINAELDKERLCQSEIKTAISTFKLETLNKISLIKSEHRNKIAEAKTTLFNLNNMVQTGNKSKETAVQLAGKIKALRDGICHTCLQSWQTELTKIEEEQLLKQLSECKTDIEGSIFASKEIETIKTALITLNERVNAEIAVLNKELEIKSVELTEQLKPQISPNLPILNAKLSDVCGLKLEERKKEDSHNQEQNIQNRKLLDAFSMNEKALSSQCNQELVDINQTLVEDKLLLQQAQSTFNAWKDASIRYKQTSENLKSKIIESTLKRDHITLKRDQLTEDLEVAEEVKRCLKSYLSCSFDDALDSISQTATNILRAIPTMANATIRLEGVKETNSGALKNQITACLDSDGELDIPIKSLSGGERSAVDLAIDLAVCEMIQEKANKGIDIMVLDEPFNAMDPVCIENCIEMLKTFATNKRILFVEHDSVAKELVDQRITIIRDGETSFIK